MEEGVTMQDAGNKVKDPVCSMTIDPTDAVGYEDYQGQRYYFCAETCQKAFQQDPERYAKQAA
jgi:P-type Cu+ transporter